MSISPYWMNLTKSSLGSFLRLRRNLNIFFFLTALGSFYRPWLYQMFNAILLSISLNRISKLNKQIEKVSILCKHNKQASISQILFVF